MESILKKLYYGNLDPSIKRAKSTPHYDKINDELDKCENMLYDYFKENNLDMLHAAYERSTDLKAEIVSYEKADRFTDGFILCASLVMEIISHHK